MWSVMQPETKLMSMGHTAAGVPVDGNGLCSHMKPDLMSMSVIRAASEGLVWVSSQQPCLWIELLPETL